MILLILELPTTIHMIQVHPTMILTLHQVQVHPTMILTHILPQVLVHQITIHTHTYTPSYSGTSNYDTYVPTSSYSSGSSCSSCASHGYSYNGGYSTGGGYTYMPQASHYVYIPQRTTSGSTNNTTIVSNNNNNNGNNSNNQLAVNYYNNGVYYPNGYYGNNATNYSAMSGSCVVSYTGSGINTPVTWSATASGGSGSFSYSWTGSDNLYGNGQSITGMYATAGYKTATVTITSTDGQSISRSCNTNVGNINTAGVTVTRDITPTNGTPVAGVFLNQVPATGISFNLKVGLFILGLLMWSAFMTYIFIARKNRKAQLAGNVSTSNSQSLAAQFKIENMKNRGLIA